MQNQNKDKIEVVGKGKQTWQNEALDLLQDKTVWLGTRRMVVGFKCITTDDAFDSVRLVYLVFSPQ